MFTGIWGDDLIWQTFFKTGGSTTNYSWVVDYFFLIFTPPWGDDPIWLIFFRWVETTNKCWLRVWLKGIWFCHIIYGPLFFREYDEIDEIIGQSLRFPMLKGNFIFQPLIFRWHVSFPGGRFSWESSITDEVRCFACCFAISNWRTNSEQHVSSSIHHSSLWVGLVWITVHWFIYFFKSNAGTLWEFKGPTTAGCHTQQEIRPN